MGSEIYRKLVVALGDYGAGKTTFSKWYAKNNDGEYLDFELLYFEDNRNNVSRFDTFVERLTSIIQRRTKNLFVMDGYQVPIYGQERVIDPPFAYLREKTNCNIQLCLCFAAPHVIHNRQESKAHKRHITSYHEESEIKQVTQSLFETVVTTDNPLFVDTTNGFQFISKDDWNQRWRELLFFSYLDKMPHDKYYQEIELPSGLQIPGYSDSNKTWERLNSIIDFRGKDVLDLACFHGFFSFMVEETGAQNVVGVEINENAIEICRRIAWIKNSKARFHQEDIVNLTAKHIYDIVLVLNVLHHISDIPKALENIFRAGRLIVFEIPLTQETIITQYADRFNFKITAETNSHREGRKIIIFSNPQNTVGISKVIPDAYQYTYRRASAKKSIKNALVKTVIKLRLRRPLLWVISKLRKPVSGYHS
ncbi:MAG: class I SAM-dependent methyltransferase [Dehalococcoidales bacterium]|nr:class I SAM-dependent methyltransferase [Dehalococcoidales bacterium]